MFKCVFEKCCDFDSGLPSVIDIRWNPKRQYDLCSLA